jgi:hypothetical protein
MTRTMKYLPLYPQEQLHAIQYPLDDDRYDNDRIDAWDTSTPALADHEAALERRHKQATIRTEMVQRARSNGYSSHGPDGTF